MNRSGVLVKFASVYRQSSTYYQLQSGLIQMVLAAEIQNKNDKVYPIYAMKPYSGSESVAPLILNLDA